MDLKAADRRFFFQAEDGIRDVAVTGVQTGALPIFFPAPDGVETVAQAVEKAGARAGEGELEAVEREVKFVNQPARGSGSQTRREVVIVVQRGIGRARGRGKGESSGGPRSLKKKKTR